MLFFLNTESIHHCQDMPGYRVIHWNSGTLSGVVFLKKMNSLPSLAVISEY